MYEVVIVGHAERTLRLVLEGLVEEWRADEARFSTLVTDQARLVAVIDRLHEYGIGVHEVRHPDGG
jgi:hypothetical protein